MQVDNTSYIIYIYLHFKLLIKYSYIYLQFEEVISMRMLAFVGAILYNVPRICIQDTKIAVHISLVCTHKRLDLGTKSVLRKSVQDYIHLKHFS